MLRTFSILMVLGLLLYAIAVGTLERETEGRVVLRWATDPNPARLEQCRLFEKLNPGIHIVPEAADNEKLLIQCAVGVGPDIMDMAEAGMQRMVDAGVLLDLTESAASGGFSVNDTYAEVRPVLEANGRQYRFPCNVSANVIIYNRKIFDDHGVPYPKPGWTYGDFTATSRALLQRPSKSGKHHMAMTVWDSDSFFRDLLVGHGADLFDESGEKCLLDSPEALAAFRLYSKMIFVDGILPTPEQAAMHSSQGGWGFGGINLFSSGEVAMISIGRWYTVQMQYYPNLRGQLGVVEVPRLEGRKSASEVSSRAAGVNRLTKHPREALQFMRFLAGTDYGRVIVEGGDGLPPNPALARTGQDLVNAEMPDASSQQVFLDAVHRSRSLGRSRFIDAAIVDRWLMERVNEIENKVVTPEEASRSLTREINEAIGKNPEFLKESR